MRDLTEGNVARLILRFSAPMIVGNIFQQLYNLTDTIIVGHFVGKEGLGSVGASAPIIFTLVSLIIGIASGGTIIISQLFGARDYKNLKSSISTLYLFLFFSSLIICTPGIIFSREIFQLLKLPRELMTNAILYFRIYMLGLPIFFLYNATSAILNGLGDSKTPLYFLIFSTILNIILDLILIIIFKMGVGGAAIATVISEAIAFILIISYLNNVNPILKFDINNLSFNFNLFKKFINVGLPTGIQHILVSFGMTIIQAFVNKFGTNVVAAYSAASRIDSLAMLPAMTLGNALSIFTGQNIGAGKKERISKGLSATCKLSIVIALLISGLVIFSSESLMKIFISKNEVEVINIGKKYLTIIGSSYFLFSLMFSLNGVIKGAGDTFISMLITFISLWIIRVPLAYTLSVKYEYSGIWIATPISWAFGTLITYFYYKTNKWQSKNIIYN